VTTPHLTHHGVTLEPAGNGVSRLSWTSELQDEGFEAASTAVRSQVELALGDLKQSRVEALVDPEDTVAIRIATWSGLHREGVMRDAAEVDGERVDRVLFSRILRDSPITESKGFRSLLNSFLPRKRAISQMLIRDTEGRVLLCKLTYKQDWDLPGGVVEVGESPHLAVSREVQEELGLTIAAGPLVLTDWLPPWGGWDDAVCLVFDGGQHDATILTSAVLQAREIRSAQFCTVEEVRANCADFTARRIESALANLGPHGRGDGPSYTESGSPTA
jgi:8-oxo-dGTP pyrophosphatase MutT (NUDIX family)